jgi:hypothetical protein
VFAREDVGGAPMMVASLREDNGDEAPIMLTLDEYEELVTFIMAKPKRAAPQLLVPVGTIKSGKSTIVAHVVDRLAVALRQADARNGGAGLSSRPPPVFFKFSFKPRCTAEGGAREFLDKLQRFARKHGIAVTPPAGTALDALPDLPADVAAAVRKLGYEFWLLLDEVQGPILGSDVAAADTFVAALKQVRAHAVWLQLHVQDLPGCSGSPQSALPLPVASSLNRLWLPCLSYRPCSSLRRARLSGTWS